MSLSRLFRPNNDRSILRNMIADREGWEKIVEKPLPEIKKTKLVSLNQQIDSFASKWAFKGIGALWNPQFIKELLELKTNESTQSSGQKVFAAIWIHPMLMSLRVAKYCPAIGYSKSDMTIMSKAVSTVSDKIVINPDFRNLEVIDDSFHSPDPENVLNKEDEETDEINEHLNSLLDELVVTEERGMNRVQPLDSTNRSMASLGRQDGFDHGKESEDEPEDKPEDKPEAEPEDEPECKPEDEPKETIMDKIEPKLEKESLDTFDIRSLLCGYRHEVNENVKI